jgi:glycosyltransferase involved in cell wall biosynthesis
MKVAVHLPSATPTLGGGFTFQASLHAAILKVRESTDHEFVLFTESAVTAPAEAADSAEFVHIPSSRGDRLLRRAQMLANHVQDTSLRRRYWQFDTRFEQLVRAAKCDLVWFATMAYAECSLPYIYTVLDQQHLDQPWFPEVGNPRDFNAREQLMRAAISRASCILTPNQQGEDELTRSYAVHPSRILKVPHPTPDFALEAAARPLQPLPEELGLRPGYLLYPAQFWAHKNHVTLLRAFKRLIDGGFAGDLVLVGSDKGNRGHVENVARQLGVESRVRMLGFVEISTLIALYQHAACLTYTSMFGPENLPPLEAFALGCPVVCGNYRGAKEQLGDAASYFELTDDAGLALAIQRVLDDVTLRHELIERGQRRAGAFTAVDYLHEVIHFLDRFALVRANWQ